MSAQGSSSKSGVQFFPGQEEAIAPIFGEGGIFSQLLAGKPNAGQERATSVGLQQLANKQASQGVGGQPLAMRQNTDFLTGVAGRTGDNFIQTLQGFMQPAGTQSKGASAGAGVK